MVINNLDLARKITYLGMAVSNNTAAKPIEKLILFENDGDTVYGYTGDGENSIRVEIGKTSEDFYALVDYISFMKFIKACEGDITLEASGKFIQIKASNMKGKLPNGAVDVPRGSHGVHTHILDNYPNKVTDTIDLGVLKSVLDINHPVEIYRNIYFGDNILVSDTDSALIVKKKIFDRDLLLSYNSAYILTSVSNIEYGYFTVDEVEKLAIKSDELFATMVIHPNDNNDFQYSDFIGLFDAYNGDSVEIDASCLSKAVNAASMFHTIPSLVFNNHGIFVKVPSADFEYKISDTKCSSNHTYVLNASLAKQLTSIGKDLTIYYANSDIIKCESNIFAEILSSEEVSDE